MKLSKFIAVAAVATVLMPAMAMAEKCAATLSGGTGGDIQAAIDAAEAGDKICLSGTFTDVAVVIPGDKPGLTLTSESKKDPAVLSNLGVPPAITGITLLDGADSITISDLIIDVFGFGINGIGNNTNISILRNEITSTGVVANSTNSDNSGWVVADNTIQTEFVGIAAINADDITIRNNDISFIENRFAGVNGTLFGMLLTNNADEEAVDLSGIMIADNTVAATLDFDPRFKIGISLDSSFFVSGMDLAIDGTKIFRNSVTGMDFGIRIESLGGFASATATSVFDDINMLKNVVDCGGSFAAEGLQLIGNNRGVVSDVQLISNSFRNCSADVVETGDVSDVRLLGKARRESGIAGPPPMASIAGGELEMN